MTNESITQGLWNSNVTPDSYGSMEQYRDHIFQQYKIFVDMADQTSARRNLANTFFLTANTLLVGVIGFVYDKALNLTYPQLLILPILACLALCYVWWRLIHSYRQLNAAKYKVIGEYERLLPSSPYWGAEWKALGEGKNPKLYKPLTDVEHWVPITFAFIYLLFGIFVWIIK